MRSLRLQGEKAIGKKTWLAKQLRWRIIIIDDFSNISSLSSNNFSTKSRVYGKKRVIPLIENFKPTDVILFIIPIPQGPVQIISNALHFVFH